MNIQIYANDMARMTKILAGCIDPLNQINTNLELSHADNMFTIRAVNNTQFTQMSTPILGGDGESILVDGKMLASVMAKARGEIDISTDDGVCTIKSNGRTRLPIVAGKLVRPEYPVGKSVTVAAETFVRAADLVKHAVAGPENTRIVLTGMYMEVEGGRMRLMGLDGFQLSTEVIDCTGDDLTALIPGAVAKKICDCCGGDPEIQITVGAGRMRAKSETAEITCSLLTGDYVDWRKVVPQSFGTEIRFRVAELRDALSGSGVVGNENHLVKFTIMGNKLTVRSRSEKADFEAELDCEKIGNELIISFNDRYVINALGALTGETATMKLNTPVSPAVFMGEEGEGLRLVLPVRTA